MSKIRAFVVGGDNNVARFLQEDALFQVINGGPLPSLDSFDMVVFTGGEDVHPEYYGEVNHKSIWLNARRDEEEFSIFMMTKDTHYHFGICRGMQLLAIANGCKLWQDISGHSLHGTHEMIIERGVFQETKVTGVTSLHHQAIKVDERCRDNILAYENYGQPVTATDGNNKPYALDKVPEAAWFEATRSFGVQGHPEYAAASRDYKQFVFYHVIEDPDTGYYANLQRGHA